MRVDITKSFSDRAAVNLHMAGMGMQPHSRARVEMLFPPKTVGVLGARVLQARFPLLGCGVLLTRLEMANEIVAGVHVDRLVAHGLLDVGIIVAPQ